MLHIVDFRHHVLHKCPHSGVGAQAGQYVFVQSDEGAVFSAVDAEMQMLVVGVEHEICAFLLHFIEAHRVLEREMFDGYGAFAHVETFLAEHLFDKDVSRGVIHVGREGNVGRDGHCPSIFCVFPRALFPFVEDAGLFEEVTDGLFASVEREGSGVFGHESEDIAETVGLAFIEGVFAHVSIDHTVVFRVFAEEEFEIFVPARGTYRRNHLVAVAQGGHDVVGVDIEKKVIHKGVYPENSVLEAGVAVSSFTVAVYERDLSLCIPFRGVCTSARSALITAAAVRPRSSGCGGVFVPSERLPAGSHHKSRCPSATGNGPKGK